jgi:hypothetical protein
MKYEYTIDAGPKQDLVVTLDVASSTPTEDEIGYGLALWVEQMERSISQSELCGMKVKRNDRKGLKLAKAELYRLMDQEYPALPGEDDPSDEELLAALGL